MLYIKIVPQYLLHSDFDKSLRNNKEYLRKLDKINAMVYVNSYTEKDWFRLNIIQPALTEDGFIKNEYYNVEAKCSGIKYVLVKPSLLEYGLFAKFNLKADRKGFLTTPNNGTPNLSISQIFAMWYLSMDKEAAESSFQQLMDSCGSCKFYLTCDCRKCNTTINEMYSPKCDQYEPTPKLSQILVENAEIKSEKWLQRTAERNNDYAHDNS